MSEQNCSIGNVWPDKKMDYLCLTYSDFEIWYHNTAHGFMVSVFDKLKKYFKTKHIEYTMSGVNIYLEN